MLYGLLVTVADPTSNIRCGARGLHEINGSLAWLCENCVTMIAFDTSDSLRIPSM